MKLCSMATLISNIIIHEGISQSALCRGLCSTSAFSRYLNGERTLDRLLFTVVLQRLGKSPDKFVTMISNEEYSYLEWKQRVSSARLNHNWKALYSLLQEKQAFNRSCNALLQEQYFRLMQGILQENFFNNREESITLIESAIALTVPGFPTDIDKTLFRGKQLLGEQEILAILLWQDLQDNKDMSYDVLLFLMQYIEIHYQDEQERIKLYPKVATYYLPYMYARQEYHKCMYITEKAIKMMVSTGYSFCMTNILTIHINTYEQLALWSHAKKMKIQLQAWKEILQEYRNEYVYEEDFFRLDIYQEAELLHETICLCRQKNGYSQEALSEGICTPETLSRIETGKRAPRKKVYQALNDKLLLQRDYFYTSIETDDFSILEAKWQLDKFLMLRQWEEAANVLNELEKEIDITQARNRQYIENTKYIIQCGMGHVCTEGDFYHLINILNYTGINLPQTYKINEWTDSFWLHPFTGTEIRVLIQMANVLATINRLSNAVELLKKILFSLKGSQVKPEFHYRHLLLILGRLSVYSGQQCNYDDALFFSEVGIRVSLECNCIKMLPLFVNNKANALENKSQKEAALKYYRLAFYLAELAQTSTAKIAKESYENLKNAPNEWY